MASWSVGTECSTILPLALGWRPGPALGPLQPSQPPPRQGQLLPQQMATVLGIPRESCWAGSNPMLLASVILSSWEPSHLWAAPQDAIR